MQPVSVIHLLSVTWMSEKHCCSFQCVGCMSWANSEHLLGSMTSTDTELGQMLWGFRTADLFCFGPIRIIPLLGNRLRFHSDALNCVVLTQNCRHEFTRGTNRYLTLPLAATHTCSLFTHKVIMQLHCSGFPIWTGLFPFTNCVCCLHVFSEVPILWFMNEALMAHLLVCRTTLALLFSSC